MRRGSVEILFVALLLFVFLGCGKDNDGIDGPGEYNPPGDDDNPSEVIAFPGAEGGGKFTTGGREGSVFIVTSLLDDLSSGTLRWAIGRTGARTIVFAVSGTIELNSPLSITNGNVTIAGQTAPGGGITIANYPVYVGANNVIIRFIRFRLGDVTNTEADAIWGRRQKDIMIDHCSMSWSTDECASFYDNENFTMQWCVIAESLNESVHGKGAHGYGGLWGGFNATFHHNLLAHHVSRNPRFYGIRDGIVREKAEMTNNVIYNLGSDSGYGGEGGQYNIVNNYYKAGPGTKKNQSRIFDAYKVTDYGKFFIEGNYVHNYQNVTSDNWIGVNLKSGGDKNSVKVATRHNITPINLQSATEAYTSVLEHAGASLFRDGVDTRIISEVQSGTATYGGAWGENLGIIDTQAIVGGWPVLNSTAAPVDTDQDGMPDAWEIGKGLNPNDASDGKKYNLNPNYTNLEVYLNSLVSDKINFGK